MRTISVLLAIAVVTPAEATDPRRDPIVGGTGTILWSTYVGGTSDDHPTAIAADHDGNIIVAGYTTSTDINAPARPRIIHSDIFIAKFNAAGTELVY
jgi:Beta-propeller repeat